MEENNDSIYESRSQNVESARKRRDSASERSDPHISIITAAGNLVLPKRKASNGTRMTDKRSSAFAVLATSDINRAIMAPATEPHGVAANGPYTLNMPR